MERYSEYKDSGVKWLGEIPKHWEMKRWRYLMTENTTKNSDCKEKLQLQFRYGDIVKKANQSEESDVLDTISKYTVVKPEDIMINGLNLNYDFVSQRVAQVKEHGVITSAYISLRPTQISNSRYYTYFLKSMDAKKMFHGMGTGIRLTLSYNELKNQFIPCPSLKEQTAIASYLDTTTAQIDAAIAQQRKMIDLLNERKQIIINNAVTKGLNPNVKMKDSGVEWIGKVPEHWEVRKIKTVLKEGNSIKIGPFGSSLTGKVDIDLPYKIYGQWNIVGGDFFAGTNYISEKTFDELKVYEVIPGDIMISMMGTVGKCRVVPLDIQKGIMDSHVVKIRLNNKLVDNRYFEYFYDKDNSSIIFNNIQFMKKGSIMDGLNSSIIKSLILTFPSIKEQKEIIEYLNAIVGKIDRTVNNIKSKINLLQERKQIIINDVVTGKVKVSN